MNINSVVINRCFITVLLIFFCGIEKKASSDRFSDFSIFSTTRLDFKFISIHDLNNLFSNVLGPSHIFTINVIFVAPDIWKIVRFPSLVNSKEGQKIAFRLKKFSPFLIGDSGFIFGTEENSVDLKHGNNSDDFIGTT